MTRKERKGALVLLVVAIIASVFPWGVKSCRQSAEFPKVVVVEKEIVKESSEYKKKRNKKNGKKKGGRKKDAKPQEPPRDFTDDAIEIVSPEKN